MPTPKNIYQLKVSLNDSKPPIWRRLLVAEDTTLASLHEIIQVAMGWQNYHLHMFKIVGQIYGDSADDEMGDLGTKNEIRYRLNQLGLREKGRFAYQYDFGDSWDHTILVEKILPAEKGVHYPMCVTGKRACPPEDVGGIWGYDSFLEAMADPNHSEHDEYMEWIGGDFDPEEFDSDSINAILRMMGPQGSKGQKRTGSKEDTFTPSTSQEQAAADTLTNWLDNLNQEERDIFEALPLRRDMLTFLDYLAKNRTVGTQATGNLPLKAVREICQSFTHPPVLEQTINGHAFKVRSEDEVWPLIFVHHLAFHSNMVTGGQAKAWKVTPEGQSFAQLPHPIQVFFLFMRWWVSVDWTVAFPVSGLADGLPDSFRLEALAALCALPVGEKSPYESFADRIIAQGGLEWRIPDQTLAHSILQSVIERLVVGPMTTFGVLECEYGTQTIDGHDFRDLKFICLTPVGKALLGLLK